MDYETALKTCSEEVQAAIKWLEEKVRFDRRELEKRLKEEKDRDWIKDISRRLKVKYLCGDALYFYVLSKVNSPLLKEFLYASTNEEFWLDEGGVDGFDVWLFDEPHLLWYLSKIGLNSNEYFEDAINLFVKEKQMIKGEIFSNSLSHTAPLRVLASVEPDSAATNLAVRYFLDNLDDFKSPHELDTLAIGVSALCKLDYFRFKGTIESLSNYLKSKQAKDGYWGELLQWKDGTSYPIDKTSLVIEALSKVFGKNDESVTKGVNWLKQMQKEDGSWDDCLPYTSHALLALISAGEGPKVSLDEFEWNDMLTRQKLERSKTKFVQTSPSLGVTEIKEKLHKMLNNANERIWICSRFITEFWTDIMNLKREKPNLDVKIITLPKAEAYNKYKGDGRKFVHPAFDALQRLLGKDFITEPLLHARLYIIDNEVLVSSADITSEQLEKEYNAGIWTRDEETVEDAIKFFENIWNESKVEHNQQK